MFCSVVVGIVVKESMLLFKGPYCVSTFVAVLFKYVAVFCSVVLVVVGTYIHTYIHTYNFICFSRLQSCQSCQRVVKESILLFIGPYCVSTFVTVLFKYVAVFR